nr:glycosyltransferase [Lachnospiraceae bacterium]
LTEIGKKHKVKLFTTEKDFHPKGVENCGKIDYYQEMPIAFKCAKINLNVTLRSIERGIPLRCIDVMGAGGFLLTNYQEDMLQFFEPGVDFVYYESRQDMLEKIDYYLQHEEERKAIAASGHEKIRNFHTYDARIPEIVDIVMK